MSAARFDGVPVLVTGATGFTGSWLARRLADDGARVVATLRPERADEPGGLDGVALVRCDLTDVGDVRRVIAEHGIRIVFHLAAQTIDAEATGSPLAAYDVNVRGAYTVLEAVRQAGDGVRLLVASTYHVYGSQPEAVPFREDLPLRPHGVYASSKACADMLARSYAASYALPVAVTRLANVYGPGDPKPTRLVPDAASAIAAGRRPVIRSDGTPERDFIHVQDAVEAYLTVAASLDRRELWGRVWNAGADRPVAIGDLVRRLVAAAGSELEPEIAGPTRAAGRPDRRFLDSSAIRAELGWSPRWELAAGLADTFRWYERAKGTPK